MVTSRRRWARLPVALLLAAAVWTGAPAVAQQVCDDPSARCGGLLSSECLSRLGAGAIAASEAPACAGQLDAYRSCLSEVAAQCGTAAPAPTPQAPAPASLAMPLGHRLVAETPIAGGRFLFIAAEQPLSWTIAERAAVAMGGRLAVLDTEAKQQAMASVLARRPELFERAQVLFSTWVLGPWVGAYQQAGAAEPGGGWVWNLDPRTGASAPVTGGHWFPGQPSNYGGAENFMNIFCLDRPTCSTWNDAPVDAGVTSYIVEIAD